MKPSHVAPDLRQFCDRICAPLIYIKKYFTGCDYVTLQVSMGRAGRLPALDACTTADQYIHVISLMLNIEKIILSLGTPRWDTCIGNILSFCHPFLQGTQDSRPASLLWRGSSKSATRCRKWWSPTNGKSGHAPSESTPRLQRSARRSSWMTITGQWSRLCCTSRHPCCTCCGLQMHR